MRPLSAILIFRIIMISTKNSAIFRSIYVVNFSMLIGTVRITEVSALFSNRIIEVWLYENRYNNKVIHAWILNSYGRNPQQSEKGSFWAWSFRRKTVFRTNFVREIFCIWKLPTTCRFETFFNIFCPNIIRLLETPRLIGVVQFIAKY